MPNEPINLVGPPETVLYALFFSQANGLVKKVSSLRASNGNPELIEFLSDYYVSQAGLTQAQNNEIFQAAADYESTNAPVDSLAKSLVAGWRQGMRAFSISQGAKPASPRSQLRQLDVERNTNLMAARGELESELGTDGFYTLEVYVHKTFGHPKRMFLKTGGNQ
ncbi:MAG: hypothetical protein ACRD1F_08000 [Terriglobales bacterium]